MESKKKKLQKQKKTKEITTNATKLSNYNYTKSQSIKSNQTINSEP